MRIGASILFPQRIQAVHGLSPNKYSTRFNTDGYGDTPKNNCINGWNNTCAVHTFLFAWWEWTLSLHYTRSIDGGYDLDYTRRCS
jgi:hypothetical protein